MSVAVRPFDRRDRDQLTSLVNLHVATVIPGVVLSVNAVLGQLEREPSENIVDPWVAERLCLVAVRGEDLVAAALLHRFRAGDDVVPHYRGVGEIRWLVCKFDALDSGRQLLAAVLDQMHAWQVSTVGAECSFPGTWVLWRSGHVAAHPRTASGGWLRRAQPDRGRAGCALRGPDWTPSARAVEDPQARSARHALHAAARWRGGRVHRGGRSQRRDGA